MCLYHWARVLVKIGLHDDAQDALDKIATQGKRVEDPMEILIHKVKLAETQRFCGNLKEAEGLLLRVLKDSHIMLRGDHFKTIRILELLCYVYSNQKNWVQAELKSYKFDCILTATFTHLKEKYSQDLAILLIIPLSHWKYCRQIPSVNPPLLTDSVDHYTYILESTYLPIVNFDY